jgi:UDP:flavonoid glycosyltransferase YjiC (YdhE family)
MRILCVCCAGAGHIYPVVPIAAALRAAGHDVLFVVPPDNAEAAETAGVPVRLLTSLFTTPEAFQERLRHIEQLAPADRPPQAMVNSLSEAERGFAELNQVCDDFRPDLIVRDTMAFAGWLLAQRRKLPVVVVDFFPLPSERFALAGRGAFDATRARLGLGADPKLATLPGDLTILAGPPSWFDYVAPTAVFVRPDDGTHVHQEAPAWLDDIEPPFVYATLGTAFNKTPGLWPMILDGLEQLDVNIIATVGKDLDPATLGLRPDRIRLERFAPQGPILDRCAAALTHGGFGSLVGCLARGVPIVSVPVAASDNVPNALRMAGLGAGIAVLPEERSPERIAEAMRAVLNDASYRQGARKVADEIAQLTSATQAVKLMEDLVARAAPGPASGNPS